MDDMQQKMAAKSFAEYWKGRGYEKGESQAFWLSLLHDVYGVEHPEQLWYPITMLTASAARNSLSL